MVIDLKIKDNFYPSFGRVECGGTFFCDSKLWMKVNSVVDNAVDLHTGKMSYFTDDHAVIPVACKVVRICP